MKDRSERKLIYDGILLTVTTLVLKTAGVMFSSGLTSTAGTEAMGLSAQITSVYAFAVTAASAGVTLGAMRLTAESRGAKRAQDIRPGIGCALSYCIRTGAITAILLLILSPLLALQLIENREALLPLCLLALAIPCISASGAFHGYFNGVRRVYKSAAVNVTEQAVRITVTLAGLYGLAGKTGLLPSALTNSVSAAVLTISGFPIPFFGRITASKTGLACLTVVFGSITAELTSFLLLTVLYLRDRKRYILPTGEEKLLIRTRLMPKFLSITAPMAVSAILRSGLSAAEHLLLPRGLRAYGSTSALSEYGIVCGMAIPVVLYPMALMNSFAQLNTADISARASAGEALRQLRERVARGVSFALIYGIGCSAILRAFAHRLGNGLFHDTDAGIYIAALAGYAALSYLDHIADSALKGLDCQAYVMKVNILDSAIGLICAIVVVPRLGIAGYILSLYLCEFVNCSFSLCKLMSKLKYIPSPSRMLLLPFVCALLSVSFVGAVGIYGLPLPVSLTVAALIYTVAVIGILSLIDKNKRQKGF